MLFLRIAKQYTSLPSPFVLFIWLSTILSATRRCDDLQHIFFRAHYIRSMIRINSGKISDMGTISEFHPAVNRHPSQIPGDFYTCTTCYRDSAKASRKRGLWLVVRVNQKDGSPCPQYTVCRLTLSLSGCQYFILRDFCVYRSFEDLTTSPLSASSARTFGMTIRPLKKSAKDHTSSSFRQEPITMQATTIRE